MNSTIQSRRVPRWAGGKHGRKQPANPPTSQSGAQAAGQPANPPEFTWWEGGALGTLDTPDGRVAYRFWDEARHAPKTLIGIHGFGGNSDNFIALGEALKPHIAVYAIELHGNGLSGQPGDVNDRAVHFRNLDALLAWVQARHPNAQRYVAGYSLGVAYAALWAAQADRSADFSGLILFAPPYRNILTPPPHMRAVFNLWTRLMPTFRLKMNVLPDEGTYSRYAFAMRDRHFIRRRTLRSLKVSMDIVTESKSALPYVTLPTLIVHGDADPIARPGGARIAHYRLGATDKTLHWVPGAQHDLYDVLSGFKCSDVNDAQRALVIEPVCKWLESH